MKKIVGIALLVGILAAGANGETNRADRALIKATVSRVDEEEPHLQIVITNATELTRLVAFFGDIQNEKNTDLAGGWEAKFKITFGMSDGAALEVATSYDDKDWSSGKGDKALKPGLSHFLHPLFYQQFQDIRAQLRKEIAEQEKEIATVRDKQAKILNDPAFIKATEQHGVSLGTNANSPRATNANRQSADRGVPQ